MGLRTCDWTHWRFGDARASSCDESEVRTKEEVERRGRVYRVL